MKTKNLIFILISLLFSYPIITQRVTFNKDELENRLSPVAFQVTQLGISERTNKGRYVDHYEKGFYHCIVCDQKLFTSENKKRGYGWPTFR